MKRTLSVATKLLTKHLECGQKLNLYLQEVLEKTGHQGTWIIEGEVVEITYGDLTINYTWDMISAVNCKTNEFIDLISIKNEEEVIDFFENACCATHRNPKQKELNKSEDK